MQIVIDYDRDNIDNCKIKMDDDISPSEAVVVLSHAISKLAGSEDLENELVLLGIERMSLNGQI